LRHKPPQLLECSRLFFQVTCTLIKCGKLIIFAVLFGLVWAFYTRNLHEPILFLLVVSPFFALFLVARATTFGVKKPPDAVSLLLSY